MTSAATILPSSSLPPVPAAFPPGVSLPAVADGETEPLPGFGGTLALAALTVLALLAGLVGWALLARLDSAVITHGVVVADSRRKTVQHLEGGILKSLLVREGSAVRAGQPVALLDATRAEAELGQLADQRVAVLARRARLEAEQADAAALVFPPGLAASDGPAAAAHRDLLEGQATLFGARQKAFAGKLAVLERRIAQLRSDASGAEAQIAAAERQLDLLEEERRNVAFLLQRGIERRPRLLELERAIAALEGRREELRHTVQSAGDGIAQARLEIENAHHERLAGIAAELDQAQILEADLAGRIKAAQDVLTRRVITAPQDGVVMALRLVTPGGVLGPGQPLMDIVPADDELVIETRLPPDAVDNVHPGLPAQVRLTAYKRSIMPLVDGQVERVSADLIEDPRTGEPYFLARIRLAGAELARLEGVRLSAGMPAEVMITTGERRAVDYFLEPLTNHLRRAFREG